MANPEGEVGKQQIRRETDAFLDGVPTSSYSPLQRASINQTLELLNLSPLAVYSSEPGAVPSQPEPALTGALAASLPMMLSVSDSNNRALIFTLLINPATMNHGKTGSVFFSYSRTGYISQMWGPNQDLITSTGSTAAFMVEGEGLTAVARRRSFGLLNFLALVGTYRNNGYELVDPTALRGPLTRVINKVHGVEMYYDGATFMGHFNNFTIDELADSPFVFKYNFEFVISSLSANYNEIKGHFEPQIGGLSSTWDQPPPKKNVLVNQINPSQG